MVSHVQLNPLIFQTLKKHSTLMLVLLPTILLQCRGLSSTVLPLTKLVLLLLGSNLNNNSCRMVAFLPLCCFPVLPRSNPRTISSKHCPPLLFTVTIIPNIIRTLLPLHQRLNLQALHLPLPILIPTPSPVQAHYSCANLSGALNQTATRAISKPTV